MITVSILINGQPILTRSAVNKGKGTKTKCKYQLDDGNTILHDPNDGAASLAIKMLGCIKEKEIMRVSK